MILENVIGSRDQKIYNLEKGVENMEEIYSITIPCDNEKNKK